MTFKKFFLILAGAPAALFLALWAALWVVPEMEYMDGEYPYWMQQRDYLLRDSDKREVIFLGDSVMQVAMIPKLIGEDTYNLALGATTPVEAYYSLKFYLEHHPMPRAVFCGFHPGHYTSLAQYSDRTLYVRYFSEETEREIEKEILAREHTGTEEAEFVKRRIACNSRLPSVYVGAALNGAFLRGDSNREMYRQIAEDRGHLRNERENTQKGLNLWLNEKDFVPRKTIDFYFQKMMALAAEKNIPFYVISLPMDNVSCEVLAKTDMPRDYYSYLENAARPYGAKVFAEIDSYEPKYFGDRSHLNERGAELFSKRFKEKFYDRLPE